MREDVLAQRSIVFRMCLLRLNPSILRGIADERFLPRHGDELSPRLGQEISPVGLQPVAIPPGARTADSHSNSHSIPRPVKPLPTRARPVAAGRPPSCRRIRTHP